MGCRNSKLKNHPVMLTAAAEEAFYMLKKKCATAPVLAFADLKRPFLLEMDASKYSMGAILWEVLMLVDSEAVAQVSGAAETVDYFG